MTYQSADHNRQHTLQLFDGELTHLHVLLLEMTELLMFQLERAMRALDEGDVALAENVLSRYKDIKQYKIQIDTEVLTVLARYCPVANDLRTIISTSKIAGELEKIGYEITDFAKQVTVLFDPRSSDPNPKLLTDIFKIGHLVKTMLGNLLIVFTRGETNQAYILLQHDRECETQLREGIKHQLYNTMRDARLIGRALDIMQILKALEYCGEHCRNIAENTIYMLEGIDVRHRERDRLAQSDYPNPQAV